MPDQWYKTIHPQWRRTCEYAEREKIPCIVFCSLESYLCVLYRNDSEDIISSSIMYYDNSVFASYDKIGRSAA